MDNGDITYHCEAVVQQYTMIKDKNEVKIFEGDILKVYQDGEHVFNHIVEWSDWGSGYIIEVEGCDYDYTTINWASEAHDYEYEVVGNICEDRIEDIV